MQSMHRIQTICLFNSVHKLEIYAVINLVDIDNILPTVQKMIFWASLKLERRII